MPFWHSFLHIISLIKFFLASANDSLKTDIFSFSTWTYKIVLLSWLWVYVHLISFPFPTLHDETTQRQAYVLVSLLAKTINCHVWSIHESHTLLQCLFSTRRWWDLEQKQLSELILADTTPLVICFTPFCKFWLDFFLASSFYDDSLQFITTVNVRI